jgi:hypothetical protein
MDVINKPSGMVEVEDYGIKKNGGDTLKTVGNG